MALEKATITNLQSSEQIRVLFNPAEYSLDLGNTFAEIGIPGLAAPPIQYVRGNSRTLKMELFFDTSDTRGDVRVRTRQLTALLDSLPALEAPPILLFTWGGLNFQCVLESVAQRFTAFSEEGIPLRATLTVSFKEYRRMAEEVQRGSLVAPPTLRTVVAGDTLDKIASETLGDPEAWRMIAAANNIDDPRALAPGQVLIIPPRQPRAAR